jgi:hypothetical protein
MELRGVILRVLFGLRVLFSLRVLFELRVLFVIGFLRLRIALAK